MIELPYNENKNADIECMVDQSQGWEIGHIIDTLNYERYLDARIVVTTCIRLVF